MTATARAVQIIGQTIVVVLARVIIIRMTTRAGGLVSRRRPAYGFRIRRMAGGAEEVAAVIQWFVGETRMAEIGRYPCNRTVAKTAVLRRVEVPRVLAGCRCAIVAGCTGAKYLVVVYGRRRHPEVGAVAVLADIGCLHMRRAFASGVGAVMTAEAIVHYIQMVEIRGQPGDRRMTIVTVIAAGDMRGVFAGRRDAVMAGAASAQYLCVIDRKRGRPNIRRVAVLADIACLDVRRSFTCCINAIVAADAVARDVDVIEVRRQPGDRRMAVVAVVTASDVCRVFASCRDAIMTGTAASQNLCMVDREYGRPDVRGVAVFADVAGLDVRRSFAGGLRAIVAAKAVAGDVNVVEVGRRPADRRMAVVAVVAAGDVGRVFAGRCDAVMTGTAGADYLRMVDRIRRRPHIAVMAVFADVAGLYVSRALAGRFRTIMATDTITRDVHVVEGRGQPSRGCVAVITGIATRNVSRVFAGCRNTVVARAADAHNLRMVDRKHGRKHVGRMAVFADVAGLDMSRPLAGGLGAVMAIDAITGDVDMVEVRR